MTQKLCSHTNCTLSVPMADRRLSGPSSGSARRRARERRQAQLTRAEGERLARERREQRARDKSDQQRQVDLTSRLLEPFAYFPCLHWKWHCRIFCFTYLMTRICTWDFLIWFIITCIFLQTTLLPTKTKIWGFSNFKVTCYHGFLILILHSKCPLQGKLGALSPTEHVLLPFVW